MNIKRCEIEVLKVLWLKILVFCDVKQCLLINIYQNLTTINALIFWVKQFKGTIILHDITKYLTINEPHHPKRLEIFIIQLYSSE